MREQKDLLIGEYPDNFMHMFTIRSYTGCFSFHTLYYLIVTT